MKINQKNKKHNRHGHWEENHPNGTLKYKGNYIDGAQDGYWEAYWDNGNRYYKGNYINGISNGKWEYHTYVSGIQYRKEYYV